MSTKSIQLTLGSVLIPCVVALVLFFAASASAASLPPDESGEVVVAVVVDPGPDPEPEPQPTDPLIVLEEMRVVVDSLELNQNRKDNFNRRIDRIVRAIERDNVDRAVLRAGRFEAILENRLERPDPRRPRPDRLSRTEAQQVLDMLNELMNSFGLGE